VVAAGLDPGETEVLSLALELGTHTVVVDERAARRTALALGLPLVGAVGLLARAKREGILPAVRPGIEALQRTGFFVSSALVDRVLREAGET
jgi:predicted nucleic acid-binding protein